MGASVRKSDDGKSSKTEPKSKLQSEQRETDLAEVKEVLIRLQALSRRPLAAGEPIAEDEADPPSNGAKEVPDPRWKRRWGRKVFEGDVALVELRSQLAVRSEPNTVPKVSGVLWLTVGIAMTASVIGAAGYVWGFKLLAKMPELTPTSSQVKVLPAPTTSATNLAASNHDFKPPGATQTASISVATVGRPALPSQTASPSPAPRSFMAAEDASIIAAKMKIGVELMTYGEVAAARLMFQRVADAGEGAGAFALAETYDPLVLAGLRLREGIMPDLVLARTWYERARDLGSLEARERISRLAQLPR
jgi:hypothetical protein